MLDWLAHWLDSKPMFQKLYALLKKDRDIEYYILGHKNKDFYETFRNPFYGIKVKLGVPNINPTAWIDIRIGYKLYNKSMTKGSKKTLGKPFIRIPWFNKYVLFEIRRFHPNDGLYYNGFITLLVATANKYYPWISFNSRFTKDKMFNFGIGWEGTNEFDKEVAEVGLKCRITSYEKATKYNPDCVAFQLEEGHI